MAIEYDENGDVKSTVNDRTRVFAREILHDNIRKGLVDLGPVTDQSDKIEDIRDMRDPQALGNAIMLMRQNRSDCRTAAEAADMLAKLRITIPNYQPTFIDHSQTRLVELQVRAAEGDKFAAALLRGEYLGEDPVD